MLITHIIIPAKSTINELKPNEFKRTPANEPKHVPVPIQFNTK